MASFSSWLDRTFGIAARGSSVRTEVLAGIATFLTMVYIVAGVCSGIAGLIATSNIRASDANNLGLYLELDAILAVLIGGTALTGGRYSLLGSIVGTLIIQTTTTMILTRGVAVEVTLLVKAVIVVVVALFQAEKFRNTILKLFGRGRA